MLALVRIFVPDRPGTLGDVASCLGAVGADIVQVQVLQSEAGNKTRAAETLGIDPSTLHRKLSRFGAEA